MTDERERDAEARQTRDPVPRSTMMEQLTLDDLAAGHQERAASPLRGTLAAPPPPPAPPRIPRSEQRAIRRSAALALLASVASVASVLTVDPVDQPLLAGGVALLCGTTVSLVVAPILLVESYRRGPGLVQVRRRRAMRRGFLAGALVAGYMAARLIGVGGPTWLVVAALLGAAIEAALSRADGAAS